MRRVLSLIIVSILFISNLNAQLGLEDVVLKRTVKKLQFDTVEYKVYGKTIKSVRLSKQSHNKLSKHGLSNVKSLYENIKAVEKSLDESKIKLIDYKYPFRRLPDIYINGLNTVGDIAVIDIYKNEINTHEKLYKIEYERLKKDEPEKLNKIFSQVF